MRETFAHICNLSLFHKMYLQFPSWVWFDEAVQKKEAEIETILKFT